MLPEYSRVLFKETLLLSLKGDAALELLLPSGKGKFAGIQNPEQESFPGQGQCCG